MANPKPGERWLWAGKTWRVVEIDAASQTARIVNVECEDNTARVPLSQFKDTERMRTK